MTNPRHLAIALLIWALGCAIAYVSLSVDFRLGDYRLSSETVNVESSEWISKLYEENHQPMNPAAEVKNPETVYQITRTFYLNEAPSESLSYFTPRLKGDAILKLNNSLVPNRTILARKLYSPSLKQSQLSVDIPRHYLFPKENRLGLVLTEAKNFKGLNREYLGPKSVIQKTIDRQALIEKYMPSIILSLSLILIVISLIGFIFSKSRLIYLMNMGIASVLSLCSIASGNSPLSNFIKDNDWLGVLCPLILLVLLLALWLVASFSQHKWSSLALGLIFLALTGPVLTVLLQLFGLHIIDAVFISYFTLLSALPLLLYVTITFTSQDLSKYASIIVNLRKTIGEQRDELDKKSRIIAEEMQRRAILEERQRMMRDIHDGIGGQLLSLLLQVRTGTLAQKDVAKEIQYSLNDLRLVVDSIDHIEGDLEVALATFRARVEPQIAATGIKLSWKQSEHLQSRKLSPEQTLQLYRFMQEALTNIARHSKATSASVSIELKTPDSPLQINIEDDGIGLPKNKSIKPGKGLKNLQVRAKKLSGTYEIKTGSSGTGTHISLTIPQTGQASA